MPRTRQFTDEQVIEVLRQHPKIQDAAAALKISRQALLMYRKRPAVVSATGATRLPAPTREEQRAKEQARERKKELTAPARAPTLDEITDAIIDAFQARRELNRVRNVDAATIAQLRRENEVLRGRLSLLDKAEQRNRAYAIAVDQGDLPEPLGVKSVSKL